MKSLPQLQGRFVPPTHVHPLPPPSHLAPTYREKLLPSAALGRVRATPPPTATSPSSRPRPRCTTRHRPPRCPRHAVSANTLPLGLQLLRASPASQQLPGSETTEALPGQHQAREGGSEGRHEHVVLQRGQAAQQRASPLVPGAGQPPGHEPTAAAAAGGGGEEGVVVVVAAVGVWGRSCCFPAAGVR